MRTPTASAGRQVEARRRAERRFAEAVDGLGSRNMSDTKWREVVEQLDRLPLHAKFVDEGSIRVLNLRPFAPPLEINVAANSTAGPVEYRHIEWVEYRGADHQEVRRRLEALGRLPLVTVADGFRLQAYGPTVADPPTQ